MCVCVGGALLTYEQRVNKESTEQVKQVVSPLPSSVLSMAAKHVFTSGAILSGRGAVGAFPAFGLN